MKIVIGGSWDGAKRAMDAASKYAKTMSDKISASYKNIKSNNLMSMLGANINSLGIGLTAGGALASLGILVNKLDNIGKAADNLGVTTDEIQRMEFAAARTNTNIEQVRAGFAKIIKMTADASAGNAEAKNVFAQLGLDPDELAKLNPKQIFDAVNEALSTLDDQQSRNAISAKLYGESYLQLNNFLRDYLELGDEASSLGLIVDEEQIRAAEKLDDAITNLNNSLIALVANTGVVERLSEIATGFEAMAVNAERAARAGVQIGRQEKSWEKVLRYINNGAGSLIGMGWLWGKEGLGDALSPTQSWSMATATYSGPTTQQDKDAMAAKNKERAKKDAQNEERQKRRAEASEYALIDQAARDAEAAAQKQAEVESNAAKRVSDRIEEMENQAKYQQMINAGLEKEVEIEKALDAAQKAKGPDLTAAEAAAVTQAATDLYNSRKAAQKKDPYRAPEMGFAANALERIGANTGLAYQAPNSMQSQQLVAIKQAAAAAQKAANYTQQIAGAVTAPGSGSDRIMIAP